MTTEKPIISVFMVRLKPRNEKRGIKLRRYHVFGQRFDEERGWYKVNEFITDYDHKDGRRKQVNLIEYLRGVHQNEDLESPLAFDVCTIEEAEALDRKAAEEKLARASATDLTVGKAVHPNDLTSTETRGGTAMDDGDLAPPVPSARTERGRSKAKSDAVPLPE